MNTETELPICPPWVLHADHVIPASFKVLDESGAEIRKIVSINFRTAEFVCAVSDEHGNSIVENNSIKRETKTYKKFTFVFP